MSGPTPQNVVVPMKLDAFVLNEGVATAAEFEAKIAPLTQPNYSFLQFQRTMVLNDILRMTDLHSTEFAHNSRCTNLGTGDTHENRRGVYLHWMVPRSYRAGTGISNTGQTSAGPAPSFTPPPPRWLIIRKVDSVSPAGVLPEVESWVVESDKVQYIDDLPQQTDLQVDVSPFVYADPSLGPDIAMAKQAEVFIGSKTAGDKWEEEQPPTSTRANINLVNSSNPMFPDYQPHNSNVFSVVDTFSYVDANQVTQYAESASVSYYIIGWHSSDKSDLFYINQSQNPIPNRGAVVQSLSMTLTSNDASIASWEASTDSTRLLCHGAMYNVNWQSGKRPAHVPANDYCENLMKTGPIAVGTTPLDALMSYIQTHAAAGGELQQVEQDLHTLEHLLHGRDDGVDGQAEADDMIYNWNYQAFAGGTHWFLGSASQAGGKSTTGTPTMPTKAQRKLLTELNSLQALMDGMSRQVEYLRWQMFAQWWICMTNPANKQQDYSDVTKKLLTEVTTLLSSMKTTNATITSKASSDPSISHAVLPSFFQARDPTLVIAGLEPGWPTDYLDPLKIRLDTQLTPAKATMTAAWTDFCDKVLTKLPASLVDTAKALINEFLALNPTDPAPYPSPPPSPDLFVKPLYHDQGPNGSITGPWRDQWGDTQPWFPLIIEWEGEYTHIPFDEWELEPSVGFGAGKTSKVRYTVTTQLDETPGDPSAPNPKYPDRRTLAGRNLILPQANFSLSNLVQQVLTSTPAKDMPLNSDQQKDLQNNLSLLQFLSAPMSGFFDHLRTRVQGGTHVKPTVRLTADADPTTIPAAVDACKALGFGEKELDVVQAQTDLLPYGTLVNVDPSLDPFKPVTHGQFRFTSVNIIDKFGQAIHANDPTPAPAPPPIYPIMSEYYAPGVSPNSNANTIKQDEHPLCQYIQITPQINQPARLNAAWTQWDADAKSWTPMSEWENPIWGWVVMNYANRGLQLFLPDGTFYREVSYGLTPSSSSASTSSESSDNKTAWLPFAPPSKPPSDDPNFQQLQLLVNKLDNDAAYLASFVDMLNTASNSTAPPPTAFGEFMTAIIGRPYALVRFGMSLELATDAFGSQSTLFSYTKPPPHSLLPPSNPGTAQYAFHAKLGDFDRAYDGLVAYFELNEKYTTNPGDQLNFDRTLMYPSPTAKTPPTPLIPIAPDNYPALKPGWTDPYISSTNPPSTLTDTQYTALRNEDLVSVGALIDPFFPVHIYSGILPAVPLSLPAWTWQTALGRMTAFLHAGPVVLPTDVPDFDPSMILQADYADGLATGKSVVDDKPVLVPGLGGGAGAARWAWLQPYHVDQQTEYMAVGLAKMDPRPKFQETPYTAVDGYLQLMAPMTQEVVKPDDGK